MATTTVPTKNPLLSSPFVDPDESSYGEVPVEKQLEIRVANATPGAGALVEARNSGLQIAEAERVGETLELYDATAGLTPSPGVTLSAVATNPAGYGGTTLQGAAAAVTGAVYVAARSITARDLTVYSGATQLRIWSRISNLTNVTAVRLRIGSGATPDSNYLEWNITPSVINAFEEKTLTKSAPSVTLGTFNWNNVTKIGITLVVTASYTGNVLIRDLRIGTTQTAMTVPTGHLANESSYDWRVRYRDAASPSSTFGPWSSWATFKVSQPPVVTPTAPANAAVVTDPTPAYTWTFSSPGGKAQASAYVSLYEVVAGQDQLVDVYPIAGPGLSKTQPAFILRTGRTYAWTVTALDTDGLATTSSRRTFTTTFTQPATPTGLAVAIDVDKSAANLSWTGPLGALEEWRVYRKPTGGDVTRISATGKTWADGDASITSPALNDQHLPEGVQVEYLVSAHSGSASSEGESATTSSTGQLLAGRWVNVIPGATQDALELIPTDFTETPDLQIEETEIIDRDTLHVARGVLLQPRLSFTLFVSADELATIAKLRAVSEDPTLEYSILKSPTGDVWRVQYGTIPRNFAGHGNSSASITATVVST
jgi:hypothetical protein